MVVGSLSLGGLVGVALSGGFLYLEIGRYATPQVPATLFDERKELAAYTVGLFVGVPLAVTYLLFALWLSTAALLAALVFLLALVGGTELATWLLVRSRYWGSEPSRPFYVLGFRAGVGGIVALAIVAAYLGAPSITLLGTVEALVAAVAAVALQAGGGLLSLRRPASRGRPGGGPGPALVVGAIGYFLLGLGPLGGTTTALGGPLVALLGGALVYTRLRPILGEVPPPSAGGRSAEEPSPPRAYGRTTEPSPEPPRGPSRP